MFSSVIIMKRKVKKVIDGDTFKTHRKVNGSDYVRLSGYNAPEKHQFGGKKATNRLRGMIGGRTVNLSPVGKSYGRTVAKVSRNGKRISERLKKR